MKRSTPAAVFALTLILAAAPRTAAQPELHGFVEAAGGVRFTSDDETVAEDYTLRETRAQIRLNAHGDASEAFVRLDFLQDGVTGDGTDLELREAFLRFTTAGDHLDVKAGRQALTWGTGDLLFINDLFPKDWDSFFAGREDQYLKAPSDAVRLGLYGLPFDVDAVLTPEFTADRLPAPRARFSVPFPPLPVVDRPTVLENAEVAVRLTRQVGNFGAALYGYRGFFKTPSGVRFEQAAAGDVLYYPELSVYGASLRGSALGGIGWVEAGYYDSRDDRNGTSPRVPNSSTRAMVGLERQFAEDFNATFQWYGEWMMDHGAAMAADPVGTGDEWRHVLTLRLEKWMLYQTVRLSFFGFWSPTDEDAHLRPLVSYRVSDEVEITIGANVFEGNEMTTFGSFDRDDNVYARLRYGF